MNKGQLYFPPICPRCAHTYFEAHKYARDTVRRKFMKFFVDDRQISISGCIQEDLLTRREKRNSKTRREKRNLGQQI